MAVVRIDVSALASDILAEVSDLSIMTKYQIESAATLYRIYNRLVTMGVIDLSVIKSRLPAGWQVKISPQDDNKINDLRKFKRNTFYGTVEICELGTCSGTYEIKDISELGLRLAPISVRVGESKQFLIRSVHFDDVKPIELTAICRWTDGRQAGFLISSISPSNVEEIH